MDLFFEYDENLSNNLFFKHLQSEHKLILETAPLENWIVCIPRKATIQDSHLENSTFLLAHILIPNDDLPETHFTNLLGDSVRLMNKKLTRTTQNNTVESIVLFEEIFYIKGLMKYKVWCIDTPMIECQQLKRITNGLFVVRDLKDAVELIWNETQSKVIFRKIDNVCANFVRHNKKNMRLDKLKSSIEMVYNHCLQNLLFNKRLKEKCRSDANFYKILKIALETYLMSVLYEFVFDGVTLMHMEESEAFNKIVRNLADIHLDYFGIEQKYMDVVACVRVELLKIEECTTSIEKLGTYNLMENYFPFFLLN